VKSKGVLARKAGSSTRNSAGVLDALLRKSASELLARILLGESGQFLQRFAGVHDEFGRDVVVRNGYQPRRKLRTGLGPVDVRLPKMRSRTGTPAVFRSNLVPRYVRNSCDEVRSAAWHYLHGVFHLDLNEVLVALLGPQAAHIGALVPAEVRAEWVRNCVSLQNAPLAASPMARIRAEFIAEPNREITTVQSPGVDAGSSILAVIGIEAGGSLRLLALHHGHRQASPTLWGDAIESLLARGLELPARIERSAYTRFDEPSPDAELWA
jgi:putative transposase